MVLQFAPFQCGRAPQHRSCHNTRLISAMRVSCGICTESGRVVPSDSEEDVSSPY